MIGGSEVSKLESSIDIVKDVGVDLEVRLGSVSLTMEELLSLKSNSLLKLDEKPDEFVEIMLNNKVVARGNLVIVDDQLGVEITGMA